MPIYVYEAVNEAGKKVTGTHRALNKQTAINELREQNLMIRSVQEKQEGVLGKELSLGKPVKMKDFVVFCRQFATLIRSGVQIDKAIDIMEDQTTNRKLKAALKDISEQVLSGKQLSQALRDHPRIFPEMFINMIVSGESSGQLDEVLERMASHYEKEHQTVQKVKSAMVYPVIVFVFSIAVVIFLLLKIVPAFVSMFKEQGEELPLLTQGIMLASDIVVAYWWVGAFLLLASAFAVQSLMSNQQAREMLDRLKFKLPLFGAIYKKAAIARLSRTMASLYTSGVPLLESIEITNKVTGNRVIGAILTEARSSLSEGKQLSEPFIRSGIFPRMVTSMLMIGEETGQIDSMFTKIAEFFESEVEEAVDRLKATIEPLMLLFVSGIVGMIISAIMSPMFKMYENLL